MRGWRAWAGVAAGLAAALVVLAGCWGYARVRPAAVVVYDAPPPVRVTVRPAPPVASAIWIEGYWQWSGATWVWEPGRWEQPRVGHVWVQPRWNRRGRGWVFVGGGWRPHGQGRVGGERRGRGGGHGGGHVDVR